MINEENYHQQILDYIFDANNVDKKTRLLIEKLLSQSDHITDQGVLKILGEDAN